MKLLQLLAGASSLAFWTCAFVVDMVLHTLSSLVLMVPFVVLDQLGIYSDLTTIG